MNEVIGIGVDLTQHVPLVYVSHCPSSAQSNGRIDAAALARHWPPATESYGNFQQRAPAALLPLFPGESLMVGDAAATHRRSSGLPWPPECQVPFSEDIGSGTGRIPLVAAWASLMPDPLESDSMVRRVDHEFSWSPDGVDRQPHTARAGEIIAASIKAFLENSGAPFNKCMTGIVVPDALDEGGQQILLDSLSSVGISTDKVHLVPRPLAVAVDWCNNPDNQSRYESAEFDKNGKTIGRLRVLTTPFDTWEAQSFEIRARRYADRVWLSPVRDRFRLVDAIPELEVSGLRIALTLASRENDATMEWWKFLFSGNWLSRRIMSHQPLTQSEVRACREISSSNFVSDIQKLQALRFLKARFLRPQSEGGLRFETRWDQQESLLETTPLPLLGTEDGGAFSFAKDSVNNENVALPEIQPTQNQISLTSTVRGAALAAAAIGYQLPCYRETLLPLDLFVLGKDDYDDPSPHWEQLVSAESVEAGLLWRSPNPVAGLEIRAEQDSLLLPLRRKIHSQNVFRSVGSELTKRAETDEAVRISVEMKPGQGFARVKIDSITPGVFSTRLDWRTMEECDEPKPPPLAYMPGVSRIIHDKWMFISGRKTFEQLLAALESDDTTDQIDCLRDTIFLLNKWPLARTIDEKRGTTSNKDFMIHYGIIASDSVELDPLLLDIKRMIGKRFFEARRNRTLTSDLGKNLLRAGGWFYLNIPNECREFLKDELDLAGCDSSDLSIECLHSIGLAIDSVDQMQRFFSVVVDKLESSDSGSHEWIRSIRNLCRFRNLALSPDTISNRDLKRLVQSLLKRMRAPSFRPRIFANCLETIPFLLKRRRYDPSFLDPESNIASELIQFLEDWNSKYLYKLPERLQEVPQLTLNFLKKQATQSDLERLLGVQ